MDLILASSSRYRRELLERLHIHAHCIAPEIDETPQINEHPCALALRLAIAKASKIASDHPENIVVGSDQVATFGNTLLGKPLTQNNARAQLAAQSGRRVTFHTAICVRHQQTLLTDVIDTHVNFRTLSESEIA